MSEVIGTQCCPARLPSYIRGLNTWAESFGLRVEIGVYPYDNDPELRLWAKWSGTRAQLLGLIAPIPSYRLPLSRGRLVVPKGPHAARMHRLLEGDVTVDGDQVALEIDFGPPAYTLLSHDGVETIAYAEETMHHGSIEALLAMGVSRDRLPTKRRRRRGHDGQEWVVDHHGHGYKFSAGWDSIMQPDGQVLYRVDTPLRVKRREAEWQGYLQEQERRGGQYRRMHASSDEAQASAPAVAVRPSYLRLVVDNTRTGDVP